MFDEELKGKVKKFLIELASEPVSRLPNNIFEQSLDILKIFVKVDFPNRWPELNQYLVDTLRDISNNISNISPENIDNLFRFLRFYLTVLEEQNAKRLAQARAGFIKLALTHLVMMFQFWNN